MNAFQSYITIQICFERRSVLKSVSKNTCPWGLTVVLRRSLIFLHDNIVSHTMINSTSAIIIYTE